MQAVIALSSTGARLINQVVLEMTRKPALFDFYQLEYKLVRARNRAYFFLHKKGGRDERKIFVIGHPRTGTGTLHNIFVANGLNSLHSAGNWHTRRYQCFSDRGNYQPYDLFDGYYRNAVFLLNTRPAYAYVKSRLNRTIKSKLRSGRRVRFSVANVENEILRRNAYFLQLVKYFADKDNFLVFNIARPDAFDFVCGRLALRNPGDEAWTKKHTSQAIDDDDVKNIDAAFERLGIVEDKDNPFIIKSLLGSREAELVDEFLRRRADCVCL